MLSKFWISLDAMAPSSGGARVGRNAHSGTSTLLPWRGSAWNQAHGARVVPTNNRREQTEGTNQMGRYLLLFLLGVPLPILVLIWLLGGLN